MSSYAIRIKLKVSPTWMARRVLIVKKKAKLIRRKQEIARTKKRKKKEEDAQSCDYPQLIISQNNNFKTSPSLPSILKHNFVRQTKLNNFTIPHIFLTCSKLSHRIRRITTMNNTTFIKKQPSGCGKQYVTICNPPQTFSSAYDERKWLKCHGKEECINFSDEALSKLRKYFDSLDTEGKGSLGVEELEDPFIAFGLSENRQDVKKLIESVDEDGSGKIQFDEFLGIMLNIKRGSSTGKSNNSAMFDFFKRLSSNNMGALYNKDVSFRMNVSQQRRRKMMQSLMCNAKQKKEKGMKILQNFKNQVMNNSQLKQQLFESKKSNIYIYGFQREKNI